MQIDTAAFGSVRTPIYHYDMQLLRQTLAALDASRHGETHIHFHYAVKANARPEILRVISGAGLGADCVSGGEVNAAIAAGFPCGDISFAGVGKADWEIDLALRERIGCFNVESLPELEVINERAAALGMTAPVCLRINPDVDAHTHEKITTGRSENKFGIPVEDAVKAVRIAAGMANVRYRGLHFHIGSNVLNMEEFVPLCVRINELQCLIEAEGLPVAEIINVGGGLGVSYEEPDSYPVPDFDGYVDVYRQHLELRPGQQLYFEPGRSVVAQCGTLISRVLYVKPVRSRNFLILDAGFTELIRPAFYNAYHKIENLSSKEAGETYDVVGPICESSDVFQTDVRLPRGHRGDLIALRSAGAYGETMASGYNLRPLPDALLS